MKTALLKPLGFAFFLGLALLNFSNCNKLLDAFELNSSFSEDFTIDIGPDDALVYMDQFDIDLSSNQDFVDNAEHISKFTIKEISYIVVSYIGDEGIMGSGTTTFYSGSSQIGDAVVQSDVDFAALYVSGNKVILPVSQATLNGLSDVLKNTMKFSMKVEGLVSGKPVYVVLEVTVDVNANVEP